MQRAEAGAAVAECEGLLPPKHDAGTATRHYRAFWQRRCRAAAAEAVLKPSGGNCAVLPYINALCTSQNFSRNLPGQLQHHFAVPQRGVRCNQALQFFPHAGDFARWNANAGHFFHTDGQHDAAVRLAAERLRVSAPNKKVMFHWVPPGCLWADIFGYYSRNFQKSVYFAAKNLYNIKIIAPCAKRTDCQAGSCGCA